MKRIIKIASSIMAAIMLLPLASCSGASPTGVPVGTEMGEKNLEPIAGDDFLSRYGDFDAVKNWIRDNVTDSDLPPISFSVRQKNSRSLSWKKTVVSIGIVTDFSDTDDPAERDVWDVVYVCEDERLQIDVRYTFYPGFPIVEYDAYLTNLSEGTTEPICNLYSVNSNVTGTDEGSYTLHYNRGSLGYDETDYTPYEEKIRSSKKIETDNGMPTSAYLPYFNVSRDAGGGVIIAVNWQGSWFANFKPSQGSILVQAGQKYFKSVMTGGERFKLPGTVLLFYKDGDWQEGQNIWRRWIIKHNLMRYTGRRDYKQNVFVCSPITGAEHDLEYIGALSGNDVIKKYNCVYEIDAGWYGNGNLNPSAWVNEVGNWYPSEAYAGDGLRQISDACHEAGMGFCMWFEPERVVASSKSGSLLGDGVIYLDYLRKRVSYADAPKSSVGLINYGSAVARDYVVDLISTAVKEYGIDVYRQDFNTENQTFWSAYDAYEAELIGGKRTGATENHACEGYIAVLTGIEEANPGLVFDICSGGGRRYDLESLRFGFQHTKSDYCIEVNSQQCQNFGDSSWNIFTGTGFADPSSVYDVRSRLTLSIGIGAVNVDETMARALEEWNEMQEYLYCDYYRLSDCSLAADAVISVEFCNTEHTEGIAVAYLRAGGNVSIPLKGLDPDSDYKIRDIDVPQSEKTVSGKELLNDGYLFTSEGPSAVVVRFEKLP